MNSNVKIAARIEQVQEVSLLGRADLSFWADRLAPLKLRPIASDGFAQVLVIAAKMKFMGLRFEEISFSTLVQDFDGWPVQGAFLLGAFNSRRVFAWIERNVFQTPYEHGDVAVDAAFPAFFRLVRQGRLLFEARQADDAGASTASVDDGWTGPVFLPPSHRRQGKTAKAFLASVEGPTQKRSFVVGKDALSFDALEDLKVFRLLQESKFAPLKWAVRRSATHIKSKTYERNALRELLDRPDADRS